MGESNEETIVYQGMTRAQVEQVFQEHLAAQRWTEAVEILVGAHGREILQFLHGFLRDGHDAEEVFAQMCLKLLEEIPKFRGECSGRAWFFYKSRFAALDWVRSPRRQRERRLETHEWSRMSNLVDKVRSETRPYLKTEIKDRFAQLREQLKPEERMLLVLYKYQNMPSHEVAEAMSTPEDPWTPAKVRKRWQRLKTKIADMAKRQGLLSNG
ncbi:MAG: sigma-70 family RNA polymerase sigma factor [Myxococcota bacterium]